MSNFEKPLDGLANIYINESKDYKTVMILRRNLILNEQKLKAIDYNNDLYEQLLTDNNLTFRHISELIMKIFEENYGVNISDNQRKINKENNGHEGVIEKIIEKIEIKKSPENLGHVKKKLIRLKRMGNWYDAHVTDKEKKLQKMTKEDLVDSFYDMYWLLSWLVIGSDFNDEFNRGIYAKDINDPLYTSQNGVDFDFSSIGKISQSSNLDEFELMFVNENDDIINDDIDLEQFIDDESLDQYADELTNEEFITEENNLFADNDSLTLRMISEATSKDSKIFEENDIEIIESYEGDDEIYELEDDEVYVDDEIYELEDGEVYVDDEEYELDDDEIYELEKEGFVFQWDDEDEVAGDDELYDPNTGNEEQENLNWNHKRNAKIMKGIDYWVEHFMNVEDLEYKFENVEQSDLEIINNINLAQRNENIDKKAELVQRIKRENKNK